MTAFLFTLTPTQRIAMREQNLAEFRAKEAARLACNKRRPGYGCRCNLPKGHKGQCQCPEHGEPWPFARW